MGVGLGVAAGAWGFRKVQGFANRERVTTMIDWERAREIATNMNKTGTLTAAERTHLNGYYAELVEKCVPIITEYTGVSLPDNPDRTYAFDRVDWINANLDGFQKLFAPIEALNETKRGKNILARAWHGVNQNLMSYEVGMLLGYMARRVMGQYDLAMFGREPVADPGKLYFVEPNIRGIERKLGMPKEDFRMWLVHRVGHVVGERLHLNIGRVFAQFFQLRTHGFRHLDLGEIHFVAPHKIATSIRQPAQLRKRFERVATKIALVDLRQRKRIAFAGGQVAAHPRVFPVLLHAELQQRHSGNKAHAADIFYREVGSEAGYGFGHSEIPALGKGERGQAQQKGAKRLFHVERQS